MTTQKHDALKLFFQPRAVAVFGSMREPLGEGLTIMRNMLNFGFSGRIYPISRSATSVAGLKAYARVSDVDAPIDLAIIVTPPSTVLPIIDECGRKGIKAAVVATEGFAETGPDGAALQRQIVDVGRRRGMRLLGPNTLGVLNTANGVVTGPYPLGCNKPLAGGVSYCSQTGFLTFGVHPVKDIGYPISKICDFGNKCDLNELDVLPYLADDPDTNVICMHLEDVKDGRKFVDVARRAVAQKPILILKPGRTESAARAVSSHTGSLAGDDLVYENAFRQAGVIRLRTWREYWEVPKALSLQPRPKGNRIAIVTATGGAGVMLSDAAAECGLILTAFTADTGSQLGRLSPRLGENPVDVGPMMSVRESPFSVYEDVVPVLLRDPNVDCLTAVCHLGPPIVKVFTGLAPVISRIGKPVTVMGYGIDLAEMQESGHQMEALGLPTYFDLETAVKALGVAAAYSRIRARMEENSR
jgi:acyl-CoA synthetase (NDP forming)